MTEKETTTGAAAAMPRHYVLPNGMEIAYQSRAEVEFFFNDIFEKQIYIKHGIDLKNGDCVFDIGANIGFFTLFAHLRARNIRIYAFEPAPPLFAILSENVARHGVNARLFNSGISDRSRTASFTFYPNSSGMSSFYADEHEEREALTAIMRNQLHQGVTGMDRIMRHAGALLDERLKAVTYECRLRTISEIIREENIGVIDFLKIDVQKSELDVLRGIATDDWPRIRQIVIEVHDLDGRLNEITGMLERNGYVVAIEQDDHYENSILYNLFARRLDAPATAPTQLDQDMRRQMEERAKRQVAAISRQAKNKRKS